MADSREADALMAVTCHPKECAEAIFPVSGLPLSQALSGQRFNRSTGQLASRAYFFDAFGFALPRLTFFTERRVARGLTGDLAR